jgi:hypothetical protein
MKNLLLADERLPAVPSQAQCAPAAGGTADARVEMRDRALSKAVADVFDGNAAPIHTHQLTRERLLRGQMCFSPADCPSILMILRISAHRVHSPRLN